MTCASRYYLITMMKSGKVIALVLFLGMAVCASGQDLAGAAKKEKERRASLKNKPAVTVTNSDLAKVSKKASVELAQVQTEGQDVPPPEGEGAPPAAPANKPSAVEAAPGKSGARITEEEADAEVRRTELKDKYDRAKERLEFLTLKMRALQQQYFSFNTMQSKAQVQQELAETNLKLQAATAEEAKLKKEFDDFTAKYPVKK